MAGWRCYRASVSGRGYFPEQKPGNGYRVLGPDLFPIPDDAPAERPCNAAKKRKAAVGVTDSPQTSGFTRKSVRASRSINPSLDRGVSSSMYSIPATSAEMRLKALDAPDVGYFTTIGSL